MNKVELKYTIMRVEGGVGWLIEREGHGDDMIEQHADEIEATVREAVRKKIGKLLPPAERADF